MKNCLLRIVGVFIVTSFCILTPKNGSTSTKVSTKTEKSADLSVPSTSLRINSASTEASTKSSTPTPAKQTSNDDILQSFLQPVDFTRTGFNNFFTTIFNSSLYAERFLPACFVHLIDFLDYGKKRNKPYAYYESVFSLFHHRLKESSWVNSYALLMLIDQLPEYIDPIAHNYNQKLEEALKTELTKSLNEQSYLLKDRPDQFYNETTKRIVDAIKSVNKEGSLRDLQKGLATLLEGTFNKLIWSPHEKEDIWKTVKLIAKKSELLYNFGCLESLDDVNRLLWSLLYRFGYFIECTGNQMPMEFYQHVREDIAKEMPSFLMLEEPEEWLMPKKMYLENAITKAEIKILAQQQGILTDLSSMTLQQTSNSKPLQQKNKLS